MSSLEELQSGSVLRDECPALGPHVLGGVGKHSDTIINRNGGRDSHVQTEHIPWKQR
jgi:hypothetical protein